MHAKHHPSHHTSRAGSPLVGVVLVLFMASAIAAVMIGNAIGSVRLTDKQSNLEIAYFAAEAGLEEGAEWVLHQVGYVPRSNQFTRTLPNGATVNFTVTVNNLEKMDVALWSEGIFRGATRRMEVPRPVLPTFATYPWATKDSGSGAMVAGSSYYGRVHSDNSLLIWSYENPDNLGPDFYGLVTTSADDFSGPWENARFFAGYELNAQPLNFTSADFSGNLSKTQGMEASGQGGLVLEGATEIFFTPNGATAGKMWIKNERKNGNLAFKPYSMDSLELVYIKDAATGSDTRGDVLVHGGVVNGSLTFYSDGDMILKDSITYKNDPRDDGQAVATRDFPEASDDRVGFISKDDIFILRDSVGNMDLFGAYLATGARSGSSGRMGLLNYNNRDNGPLGTLNRYGSFVSKTMYPLGTFNSASGLLRSGFRSKTVWDSRFLKTPPPFYPPDRTKLLFLDWALVD